MGLAVVDHHRQVQLPRQLYQGAEGPFLVLRRGEVAVEVQAGLADAHHPGVGGQGPQFLQRRVVQEGGVVGMYAYGGVDLGVTVGQLHRYTAGFYAYADGDDLVHPGLGGRPQGLSHVLFEQVQVGVGVDQVHLSFSILGKRGAPFSTFCPAGNNPQSPSRGR